MMRETYTSRDVKAGCFVCHGMVAHWTGGNAQGLAARHHDATGHATWSDVYLLIHYGRSPDAGEQLEIEAAIEARR